MKKTKLMLGDNIESLKKLPDNSIDSVVTDPPYGLSAPKNSGKTSQGGFMGKKWDYDVPSVEFWKELYRCLKPGGHVLSFGGTRTYHRMVVNIEDAGFEIRDQIQWIYGSGFPKSHNIGKAVDKLEGNERVETGDGYIRGDKSIFEIGANGIKSGEYKITKGTSPYEGWGTALKPANEPICVARKPLSEKSVTENVLKWGTGGINVDGCRVGTDEKWSGNKKEEWKRPGLSLSGSLDGTFNSQNSDSHELGRFPANIILECICDEVIKGEKGEIVERNKNITHNMFGKRIMGDSYSGTGDIHTDPNCPCRLLDEQTGYLKSGEVKPHHKKNKTANGYQGSCYGKFQNEDTTLKGYGDGGGASRFFYQAKVSKAERNMGLDEFEEKKIETNISGLDDKPRLDGSIRETPLKKNHHPTVKPINLMAYLCRLITPEGGIVLDPFMGSGSTGVSAQLEGFRFVGMEMDPDYFKIAEARIDSYEKYKKFKK